MSRKQRFSKIERSNQAERVKATRTWHLANLYKSIVSYLNIVAVRFGIPKYSKRAGSNLPYIPFILPGGKTEEYMVCV